MLRVIFRSFLYGAAAGLVIGGVADLILNALGIAFVSFSIGAWPITLSLLGLLAISTAVTAVVGAILGGLFYDPVPLDTVEYVFTDDVKDRKALVLIARDYLGSALFSQVSENRIKQRLQTKGFAEVDLHIWDQGKIWKCKDGQRQLDFENNPQEIPKDGLANTYGKIFLLFGEHDTAVPGVYRTYCMENADGAKFLRDQDGAFVFPSQQIHTVLYGQKSPTIGLPPEEYSLGASEFWQTRTQFLFPPSQGLDIENYSVTAQTP